MENFERGGRKPFKGGYKGNRDGGRGNFGGNDRRDRGPVTMHSATCSSCGKTCEVPFRPTGDKPVYCRDCFAGRAAMGGDRSDRKDFRKENRNESRDFSAKSNSENVGGNGEMKKQLEMINSKLERLITAVQALTKTEKVEEAEVKVKKVSKKK